VVSPSVAGNLDGLWKTHPPTGSSVSFVLDDTGECLLAYRSRKFVVVIQYTYVKGDGPPKPKDIIIKEKPVFYATQLPLKCESKAMYPYIKKYCAAHKLKLVLE
jgi:hypothetical protein